MTSSNKRLTVAIVGASSMIGKRIAKRLEGLCRIVSVGRALGSEIEMNLGEGTDDVSSGITADVMIHCAAAFGSNRIEELLENEMVNSVGALRIARLAGAMKCRHLVYLSSISACPENAGSSYGLSKRHGQENLELASRHLGINLTTLLITQIYDDLGEARKHQPMLYRIIDCARSGSEFAIFGNNDPLRNFLFVEDLVSVVERVIYRPVSGSYNVVHPISHPFSAIANMAFEVFQSSGRVVYCRDKPDIPTVWYPRDTTLYRLIDYEPPTDLRTGMALIRDHLQLESQPVEAR